MPLIAGIDAGTGFTKAVLVRLKPRGKQIDIVGYGRARSGVNPDAAAEAALKDALDSAHQRRSAVKYVCATGFGRYGIGFRDIQVTEITSAARGAHHLHAATTTILDIGAQTTRAVASADGKVKGFKSNDKCAAGSGMFITRAAKYLEIPLEDVGDLSLRATHSHPISSICAVLAESEIINHVSAGVTVEDILRGIHDSLADRAGGLLRRVGMGEQVTIIGGVARQAGMIKALEERLKVKVVLPERPDFVCALGAALLGARRYSAVKAAHATVGATA